MKTFILLICLFTICELKAAITYDIREFKLKGKNYNAKNDSPKYGYYKDVSTDKLTLLYLKTKNNEILFIGFWVSKPLATRLPMIVIRFIGKHIADAKLRETKSPDEAMKAAKKAVENALDQRWKNNLVSNTQLMVNNPRYHRGNSIIDNNAYYEFAPYHLDTPDSTKVDYIEKPKTIAGGFQSGEIKNNLDAILSSLNNHEQHHNSLVVSNWPWKYNSNFKKWELNSDSINHHSKEPDTCKLKMELQKVNKGEKLPSMCWRQINGASWTKPPTYCNFFAQTLAYMTFGKTGYDPQSSSRTSTGWYPWGSEMTANNIHDYMTAHPELFVDLQWKDCWKYINAGYVVYFIWKNPSGAGHIATGYPTDGANIPEIDGKKVGKIVQAGDYERTKILQLEDGKPWRASDLPTVRTFLYLGYLNF